MSEFPNYRYGTGLSNVGSYQVSGKPFLTSSANVPASGSTGGEPDNWEIVFPAVTKQITVYNNGATGKDIRIAFSAFGLHNYIGNYFVIQPGVDGGIAQTFDVKATELYIMGDGSGAVTNVSVFGSLTGIESSRVDKISPSGSNWSGSSGVG
tara:strand:+ start:679 stop:1134 length:456 start_codon:yes stop_codon:yes gene_type:complete